MKVKYSFETEEIISCYECHFSVPGWCEIGRDCTLGSDIECLTNSVSPECPLEQVEVGTSFDDLVLNAIANMFKTDRLVIAPVEASDYDGDFITNDVYVDGKFIGHMDTNWSPSMTLAKGDD